jgi:type VI secretion system protein ImpG
VSTFNKYFQEELSFLRELGREFSQAYPTLAPMLADRGADPDVERLLEGVAFLTGRIRQKLDDETPEIIVALSSLLFPQLIRPLPGSTIIEITPGGHNREPTVMERGAEFGSIEVEGESCTFRATSACELTALRIEDARLDQLPAGKQELRVRFDVSRSNKPADLFPTKLRLHFAGEPRDALQLWMWVLEHTEEVLLVERRPDGRVLQEVRLGKGALAPAGFDESEALLPMDRTTFPGFRLLEEYYTLPHKFSFVEVDGTRDAAARLSGEGGDVALVFRFDRRLLDAAPVSRDSVRLHCVPAVNIFSTTAEPVRLSPMRERFLVKPAGLAAKHGEVYAIERVIAIDRSTGRRIEVPPFFAFAHGGADDQAAFFYTPHMSPSVVGDGIDVRISFGTPVDVSALPDADTVSIDLLATNRGIASTLRAGEVRMPTSTSPSGASFRNLFAVTPHVPPPFGRELHWRAVAHAAMGIRSLTEVEVLRSVLDVYNFHAIVDRQAARANELRLNALENVRIKPSERLYRGAPIRGIDIDLDVDEGGFSGEGDLYLFGAVLDRFFAHYVSLNSFSRTAINGVKSKLRYRWPARSGNLTML